MLYFSRQLRYVVRNVFDLQTRNGRNNHDNIPHDIIKQSILTIKINQNSSIMKKIIFLLVVSLFFYSCSEDEGSDNTNEDDSIIVSDAESLMGAMILPGSTIRNGDIPVPAGTPSDVIESMPSSIIITSNSSFDVPFEINTADGRVPRLVFIKLDGSDRYYEIELDSEGQVVSLGRSPSIISGGAFNCQGKPNIKLSGGGPLQNEPYTNNATVRTYSPPVAVPLDTSFLNDINFWSEPIQISFKCYEVGSGDIQISLTWNTQTDVDLWLTEPDGTRIWYQNTSSASGGELDYDNTTGFGPENIFYLNEAPSGEYTVEVNYYSGAPTVTNYNVVVKNGNNVNTYSGVLDTDDQTNLVTTFTK